MALTSNTRRSPCPAIPSHACAFHHQIDDDRWLDGGCPDFNASRPSIRASSREKGHHGDLEERACHGNNRRDEALTMSFVSDANSRLLCNSNPNTYRAPLMNRHFHIYAQINFPLRSSLQTFFFGSPRNSQTSGKPKYCSLTATPSRHLSYLLPTVMRLLRLLSSITIWFLSIVWCK